MIVYGLGDGVSIPGRGGRCSSQEISAEAHSFSCRGLFPPRVKHAGRETKCFHLPNADVMNACKCICSLPACLVAYYLGSTLQYTTRTKDGSRTDFVFFYLSDSRKVMFTRVTLISC